MLALQLLNMSICSEAYWFYFNVYQTSNYSDNQADPTESIVEWLVELKFGQQDVFTYNYNNIDSKNTVKAVTTLTDLENYATSILIVRQGSEVHFFPYILKVQSVPAEIGSPPPWELLT